MFYKFDTRFYLLIFPMVIALGLNCFSTLKVKFLEEFMLRVIATTLKFLCRLWKSAALATHTVKPEHVVPREVDGVLLWMFFQQ